MARSVPQAALAPVALRDDAAPLTCAALARDSAPAAAAADAVADVRGWASDLCQPLPLLAVLLLALNDHWIKGAGLVPGWLTGKLSDFAGLYFFPIFLVSLILGMATLTGLRRVRVRSIAVPLACLATAAVFAAAKTSTAFHALFTPLWGEMVLDPTDLLALPMVLLAYLRLRRAS